MIISFRKPQFVTIMQSFANAVEPRYIKQITIRFSNNKANIVPCNMPVLVLPNFHPTKSCKYGGLS